MVPYLSLLAFAIFSAFAQECPPYENSILDSPTREAITKAHNDRRSLLANGKALMGEKVGKKEYMKTGRNIYKLWYDCGLEYQAQGWVDHCLWQHSPQSVRHGAGENLFKIAVNGSLQSLLDGAKTATQAWWNEIRYVNSTLLKIENFGYQLNMNIIHDVGHFTQTAWDATTRVGCGVGNCSKIAIVACQYSIGGNNEHLPIFELGNGCSDDSQCNLYADSKCEKSTQLCVSPKPPMAILPAPQMTKLPADLSQCKAPLMTSAARKQIQVKHNELRARFALGRDPSGARSAKNMYSLLYDCELENEAQKVAEKCEYFESSNGRNAFLSFGKLSENRTVERLFEQAMNAWFGTIQNDTYIYSPKVYNNPSEFPQTIWGSSTRIGCGVAMGCKLYDHDAISAVCVYREPGNVPGKVIYEVGDPCKKDSDCTTFSNSICLPYQGICFKP